MIDQLKKYFENRNDIAFAFLYGSYANGNATNKSDIDIAVYFYPSERHPVEYEATVFYDSESAIWSDLQKILKKEVELLVFNRAPAVISSSAIRGIPIVIKDWGLYLDFMEIITDIGDEYRDSVIHDFKEKLEVEKRHKSQNH